MNTPSVCVKKAWIPIAFSCLGKAGETVITQQQPRQLFRGGELFAIDTSSRPGCGTIIQNAVVGCRIVFEDVPTWMFSEWVPPEERDGYEAAAKLVGTKLETVEARTAAWRARTHGAALKMKWPCCDPALLITFQIHFKEDCQWQAVLWGDTLQ